MEYLYSLMPLFTIIALGIAAGKFFHISDDALKVLINLTLFIFVPSLVFISTSKAQLSSFGIVAIAAVFVVIGVGIIAYLASKMLGLDENSANGLVMTSAIMNAGSMGSSVALLSFGKEAFILAIIFYIVVQAQLYTIGIFVASGKRQLSLGSLKPVFSIPLIYAFTIGILFNSRSLPKVILTPIEMLSSVAVPMLLLTLGVQLSKISMDAMKLKVPAISTFLRIFGGFLLAVIFTFALGIKGVERSVILISSSMPTAITSFIICSKFECGMNEVPTSVLLSYVASIVTTPLILYLT